MFSSSRDRDSDFGLAAFDSRVLCSRLTALGTSTVHRRYEKGRNRVRESQENACRVAYDDSIRKEFGSTVWDRKGTAVETLCDGNHKMAVYD